MNKFSKIKNKGLCFKVFVVLSLIKLGLKILPFSKFKSLFQISGTNHVKNQSEIIYYIKGISVNIPLGFSCLPQALTLKYFLKNNASTKLILGVNNENSNFKAHAWVEQNGEYLIGDIPFETYSPLWQWQ